MKKHAKLPSWHRFNTVDLILQVKSVRLVGVLLIVYIKDIHVGHVSLIDSDTVPTGILGIMVSCDILSAVLLVGVLLIVYIKDVHVGHVSH